jgi:large subunit ribosomal protein L1
MANKKHSKRFSKAQAMVDSSKVYELSDAVKLLKTLPAVRFTESVEIAVRLGIDPKKTDQLVRGSVSLPKGTGKSVRIAVFAEGEKAKEAEAAGADIVGSQDLADKIQGGFDDFDMTIAAPDMMKHVGKLGRVLGPSGKMPSPKAGTVTPNIADAVREFKAGKIEFRTDAGANVHAAVGQSSFDADDLVANISAFVDHIRALKPAQAKGEFIRKVCVSTSMGPGLQIAVAEEEE